MKRNVSITKIMTANPTTVHTGQKLSEVRQAMTDGGFHHVPVVSGSKLVGMLSSTDLLKVSYGFDENTAGADALLDSSSEIQSLMVKDLVTMTDKQSIRHAADLLSQGSFHSVPVVDDTGHLKGLVTTTDVMNYMLAQY